MSPSLKHMSHTHGFSENCFLNRELSLLGFNWRVLAQAEDHRLPLLERLRFLCIVSSNMDEFFEVRIAAIKDSLRLGKGSTGADGLSPKQILHEVSIVAHQLVAHQYQVLQKQLFPALSAEGIRFFRRREWSDEQKAWIKEYFFRELMPVLTPIGLDPAHPFPMVLNKSLNFAVELEGKDAFGRQTRVAIVQAPRILPRMIALPEHLLAGVEQVSQGFVFLSSILHAHVDALFTGMTVLGSYQFRVTRDTDLAVDEDEITDLRSALQGELRHRQFGQAVRLEVADNCPLHLEDFLRSQFQLDHGDVYRVDGPVNLVRMMSLPDKVDRPELLFAKHMPVLPQALAKSGDIFSLLRRQDVLLHHPFESFLPVVDFLQQAVSDPCVIAIKMTIYRTGAHSVLMEALINAARAGKEVTVVLELKARFDEEANIAWAARLEESGAHVVYGVVNYKTHAKMLLLVRREQGVLRRYAHVGTGNYHPRTATMYTDFGLMTAHEGICSDISEVFMQLTGVGQAVALKHVWQAPFTLYSQLLQAIERETCIASEGRPARIMAKMNSLVEPSIISALYRASQAGVRILLLVRGVCALRAGVAGLSENIRVRSVVGRFLEHTRIFYFYHDGAEDLSIASADWMSRNLFRRIELAIPILDPKLKRRILREGLRFYWRDNTNAWDMTSQGVYQLKKARAAQKSYCAQTDLIAMFTQPPKES